MVNMARKDEPGRYTIGIYEVIKEGREWVAYGTGLGGGIISRHPTLNDAHIALTGEPMRNDSAAARMDTASSALKALSDRHGAYIGGDEEEWGIQNRDSETDVARLIMLVMDRVNSDVGTDIFGDLSDIVGDLTPGSRWNMGGLLEVLREAGIDTVGSCDLLALAIGLLDERVAAVKAERETAQPSIG